MTRQPSPWILVSLLGVCATAHAAPFAYIADDGASNVSVIDTATNTIVATIAGVGTVPEGVAVNAAGTRVYVTDSVTAGTVAVIDTATNTVIATPPVRAGPFGVAVNPAGTRVYVANFADSTVSVIDATTNTVIDLIRLSTGATGVARQFGRISGLRRDEWQRGRGDRRGDGLGHHDHRLGGVLGFGGQSGGHIRVFLVE